MWHSRSEHSGSFISIAAPRWEMVVSKYQGKTFLTVRGPETKPTPLTYPAGAEWFGIDFELGTFMPMLPPARVLNMNDVNLPEASSRSFWLHGSAWEFPTFDNADIFVERLRREGLLVHDPLVDAVLHQHPHDLSPRSAQYRFLRATGLTHRALHQIGRARQAAALLQQGMPILDVVHTAGYFDQPHLTRSLKRFIGQTPAQMDPALLVSLGAADCVFVQDHAVLPAL